MRGIRIAEIGISANYFLYKLSRLSRHIGTDHQTHDRIADIGKSAIHLNVNYCLYRNNGTAIQI